MLLVLCASWGVATASGSTASEDSLAASAKTPAYGQSVAEVVDQKTTSATTAEASAVAAGSYARACVTKAERSNIAIWASLSATTPVGDPLTSGSNTVSKDDKIAVLTAVGVPHEAHADGSLAKKPLSQVWKFNRVRVLTGTAAGLQGWAATSVKARPYFRNLAVPNGCPMAIARASARAQAAADSLAQAKIAAIKAGRSTKTVEFGVDGQVVQEGEQEREQDDRHERGGGHKRRHGHGHKRHGCYKCRFLVGAACALGAVYAGYRYKQSDAKTSSKWLVTLAVLAVLSVGLVARHHMHGHGHGRGHHGHHHGGEHDGHHHGGGFHKRGGCRMSKLAIGAAALLGALFSANKYRLARKDAAEQAAAAVAARAQRQPRGGKDQSEMHTAAAAAETLSHGAARWLVTAVACLLVAGGSATLLLHGPGHHQLRHLFHGKHWHHHHHGKHGGCPCKATVSAASTSSSLFMYSSLDAASAKQSRKPLSSGDVVIVKQTNVSAAIASLNKADGAGATKWVYVMVKSKHESISNWGSAGYVAMRSEDGKRVHFEIPKRCSQIMEQKQQWLKKHPEMVGKDWRHWQKHGYKHGKFGRDMRRKKGEKGTKLSSPCCTGSGMEGWCMQALTAAVAVAALLKLVLWPKLFPAATADAAGAAVAAGVADSEEIQIEEMESIENELAAQEILTATP